MLEEDHKNGPCVDGEVDERGKTPLSSGSSGGWAGAPLEGAVGTSPFGG